MAITRTFITITILSLLLLVSSTQKVSAATKVPKKYTNFIKTRCNTTTYPSLCISTLTPSASKVKTSPLNLCKTALNVAIKGAKNATTAVKSLVSSSKGLSRNEAVVIRECISDMKDAVYELKYTMDAMGHLSDPDREFQWSNAKTRASAAITDAETCRDAFTDRKVSSSLRKKVATYVTRVQKLISIALSLIC